MKKYELIPDANSELFRVVAVRDFGKVKAGDRGGLVASELSLSHDGNCWVADHAEVRGDARVNGDALVSCWAVVEHNAIVTGNASVTGSARVSDESVISGSAVITDNSEIEDSTHITGFAKVIGCRLRGECVVAGDVELRGGDMYDVRLYASYGAE